MADNCVMQVGGVPRLFDKTPEGFCQVSSIICYPPQGVFPPPMWALVCALLVHTKVPSLNDVPAVP